MSRVMESRIPPQQGDEKVSRHAPEGRASAPPVAAATAPTFSITSGQDVGTGVLKPRPSEALDRVLDQPARCPHFGTTGSARYFERASRIGAESARKTA